MCNYDPKTEPFRTLPFRSLLVIHIVLLLFREVEMEKLTLTVGQHLMGWAEGKFIKFYDEIIMIIATVLSDVDLHTCDSLGGQL